MGNSFSSSNALYINFSKPSYAPGEVMEGVVAFNCLNPMSTQGIMFEITGYEYTSFSTGRSATASSFDEDPHYGNTNSSWYTGTNEFFKVTVPLGPAGNINPGQYQFGFKLMLPDSLPPSFHYQWGGDQGSVRYRARAWVSKSMNFDIKTETEVQIVENDPMSSPAAANSAQQEVTVCCCGGKGSAFIQVNLDKSAFGRGEVANVAIQARNASKSNFDHVNVKLKRRFQVFSQSKFERQHYTSYPVTLNTPGLAPGESLEGNMARIVQLQIPTDLPPTVAGNLVQCFYVIEVELDGSFAVSAIRTQVPVKICATQPKFGGGVMLPPPPMMTQGQQPQQQQQPSALPAPIFTQPPPGWNPTVSPTVDIPPPPQISQPGGGMPIQPNVAQPSMGGSYYVPPAANITAPIV